MNSPRKKPGAAAAREAAPAAQAAPARAGMMQLLERAIERGDGDESIERLMGLVDREARNAFTAAKVALKAEGITLIKDSFNEQFGNWYISIGLLVNTVGPFLSKHGLSADWDFDQSNPSEIAVSAILSHVQGHSERVTLKVPPDIDGEKNPLQSIKSSITYARSITYEAVCGLAATYANLDDDGNGSGPTQPGEPRATSNGNHARPRNYNPAEVAASTQPSSGKRGAPGKQLLADARAAADKGHATFGPFWKGLTAKQRKELSGELEDLEKRARKADQDPKRGAS